MHLSCLVDADCDVPGEGSWGGSVDDDVEIQRLVWIDGAGQTGNENGAGDSTSGDNGSWERRRCDETFRDIVDCKVPDVLFGDFRCESSVNCCSGNAENREDD